LLKIVLSGQICRSQNLKRNTDSSVWHYS